MDITLAAVPAQNVKAKPNFYTSFWVFFIGSVAGFVIETIWCLYRHGKLEIRSSMVFGPFTIIYGLGALILYLGLFYVEKNNYLHMITFGAVSGAAAEYTASLVQELLVGSVSWDYSSAPFNIGGRVCLLYSVYWGLLAVLWCKWVQPALEKFIAKIPAKINKQLAAGLLVFLVVDIIVSIVAVYRWGTRMDGVPAGSFVTAFIDSVFPNKLMEAIYPNMLW